MLIDMILGGVQAYGMEIGTNDMGIHIDVLAQVLVCLPWDVQC